MASINLFEVLSKVYGPKGLPFPNPPEQGDQRVIAGGFMNEGRTVAETSSTGAPLRKYDADVLGTYQFLPATIDGIEMPNPIVIITGEKSIVETDIVDVGTVFEKVFTKPYSITIICTLIGENGNWPEAKLKEQVALWKKDEVVTLKCASTDLFLQAEHNLVITNIAILDSQGAENVEVVQLDGKSNIDFELELI